MGERGEQPTPEPQRLQHVTVHYGPLLWRCSSIYCASSIMHDSARWCWKLLKPQSSRNTNLIQSPHHPLLLTNLEKLRLHLLRAAPEQSDAQRCQKHDNSVQILYHAKSHEIIQWNVWDTGVAGGTLSKITAHKALFCQQSLGMYKQVRTWCGLLPKLEPALIIGYLTLNAVLQRIGLLRNADTAFWSGSHSCAGCCHSQSSCGSNRPSGWQKQRLATSSQVRNPDPCQIPDWQDSSWLLPRQTRTAPKPR